MKKILLLACFATSTLMLKAQSFTLTELVNMVKMNVDDFDTYVSNKGYKYFKPFDNEDGSTKGSQYAYKQSGDGKASRFVGLHYEYFIPSDKNVVFQTSQLLEYQKIKNQIKSLGFKYVETENFNGKTFMDYENGKFKLTIVLYQTENDLGEMISNYEISITYHT